MALYRCRARAVDSDGRIVCWASIGLRGIDDCMGRGLRKAPRASGEPRVQSRNRGGQDASLTNGGIYGSRASAGAADGVLLAADGAGSCAEPDVGAVLVSLA